MYFGAEKVPEGLILIPTVTFVLLVPHYLALNFLLGAYTKTNKSV